MIGSKDRPEETNAVKVIIGIDDVEHKLFIFDNLVNEKLKGNLAGVKYIDLRFKEGYIGVK
jgi:cell division septal protein FtsQ